MQAAFLIIISLFGAAYAVWSKQGKVALGFLILAGSFVLAIPDLGVGITADIFGALSLIMFLVGVLVIVGKRKEIPLVSDIEKMDK